MAMLRLWYMLIMPAMARLSTVMPRLPTDMVPLLFKEMLICTAMESMAPMDMAATTGSVDSTAPSQLDTTLDSETNTGSGRATPTGTGRCLTTLPPRATPWSLAGRS